MPQQTHPPQDTKLEQAVLGALTLEGKAYLQVSDMLSKETFYDPQHQLIYEAIEQLAIQNSPIDTLTVVQQLRSNGKLEEAGGPKAVTDLNKAVGSTANLEYHAQLLQELHIKRQLIQTGQTLTKQGYEDTEDVFNILTGAEKTIFELSNPVVGAPAKQIGESLPAVIQELEEAQKNEVQGIPSFNKDVDATLCGYRDGDLNILAARPGQGKTAKALQEALQQSLNGYPAAFFSLEMKRELLLKRALSNLGSINSMKTNNGSLSKEDWQAINEASRRLEDCKLFIDDQAQLNYLSLKSKLRKLISSEGIRIAYIDYLQLMQPMQGHGNREGEISEISRGIKACASELNIPIIALSQLNREVDKREKPQPKLSDLRESGSLEQDASVVMFLYWPKSYGRQEEAEPKLSNVMIAKNRHGPINACKVLFEEQYGQFLDYAGDLDFEPEQQEAGSNDHVPF